MTVTVAPTGAIPALNSERQRVINMPVNHSIGLVPRVAIVLLALCLLAAGAHAVTITAIAPEVGNRGTTVEVTVTGTDFERPVTAALYQTFPLPIGYQEIPATDVQIAASTRLVCTFPIPATARTGTYDLRVESGSARPVTYTGFTILPAVSVASISPAAGNKDDTSVPVTITGAGFIQGATVKLYHTFPIPVGYREITAETVQVTSPTQLTSRFSLAGAADGPYSVKVENPGGASAFKADAYTVYPALTVTSITPAEGSIGTTISAVITGTGFIPGATIATLEKPVPLPYRWHYIRGTPVITPTDSPTQMTCEFRFESTAEYEVAGTYSLRVETNEGAEGALARKDPAFVVHGPIRIDSISPNTGALGQTLSTVYVRGANFIQGAEVYLEDGSHLLDFIDATDETVIDSGATIRCSLAIPADVHSTSYTLHVSNPGASTAYKLDAFTVTASPPTVTPSPSPTATPSVTGVPGGSGRPTDPDGNGRYEDVNGNLRTDFADVVLYFNQMAWIPANEPLSAFDFNTNGRIDFADVVWLFNHL
jgi:PKD repeat protein